MKLRHFFDHPAFVAANADAVRAARAHAAGRRPRPPPGWCSPRTRCRPPPTPPPGTPEEGGHRYSRQVAEAARLVAAGARGWPSYDVVWQSRSGPPQVPWLEPDIVDHLDALHAAGVPAVVVAPVGFVSDHVEVVWDLDTEARERAAELGMAFARAATAGPGPAVRGHGGRAGRRARARRTRPPVLAGPGSGSGHQRDPLRTGLLRTAGVNRALEPVSAD